MMIMMMMMRTGHDVGKNLAGEVLELVGGRRNAAVVLALVNAVGGVLKGRVLRERRGVKDVNHNVDRRQATAEHLCAVVEKDKVITWDGRAWERMEVRIVGLTRRQTTNPET